MRSFLCQECGRGTVRSTYVTEVIDCDGHRIAVKGVPVGLCPRCGQKYFDHHVADRVRSLASCAASRRTVLYTNEHAIPGVPDACPEDDEVPVDEEAF